MLLRGWAQNEGCHYVWCLSGARVEVQTVDCSQRCAFARRWDRFESRSDRGPSFTAVSVASRSVGLKQLALAVFVTLV